MSSNLPQREIEKSLSGCFSKIEQINSERSYSMHTTGLIIDGQGLKTEFKEGKLYCYFSTPQVLSQDEHHTLHEDRTPILLMGEKENLLIDFSCFSPITILMFQNYKCTLRRYLNDKFAKSGIAFHRLLIPTDRQIKTATFIEATPLRIGSTVYMNGVVTIEFDHCQFHLFPYSEKDKDEHFLIVDSVQEISSDNFLKYAEAILIAYGFIAGHFPREKRYCFSSYNCTFNNVHGFSFETLKRNLYSGYSPIPEVIHQQLLGIAQARQLSKSVFDQLCKAILTDVGFARTVSLIIEGNTLSLELRAPIYAIALEAMTSILSETFSDRLAPIKDKTLADDLIKDLIAVLDRYSDRLCPESLEIMHKKILNINSPTNKDKLLKPFEILGVRLPDKDKECIEQRNDFLHGRVPLGPDNKEVSGFTLEQIVLSLQFCINCLVLKSVGYSGYATYYPAINELNKKVQISEYPIRMI